MSSLRARLFATTLAALVLTLGLTIAIGAALTRRQVDSSQASVVARLADDRAQERRQNVRYTRGNQQSGSFLIMIQRRPTFASLVPDVNHSSNGQTTYNGKRQLYSYRTIPHLGLLVLRPTATRAAAWRPFLVDLLLAALAGVVLAAALSFLLARSLVEPLKRIAAATRALAADESHEPLKPEGTSELVALADAFNEMTRQLAASRDAERAFLLSVSHELKTPLTAIRGYAEGLAEGAFEPEEAAATISIEAQRLERLVRDLLDLARMNRSEFSVGSEPVDVAEIAREAVARHEVSARQFDVDLVAAGSESWVQADGDRLLQIASNLVENALRATPAGGRVTVTGEGGRLVVADTGPGISPDDLPHAFERFYLYDKASRDRRVGSGLGLAIVKQLATAMGGEVQASSGSAGAAFTVTFPQSPIPTENRSLGPVKVGQEAQ